VGQEIGPYVKVCNVTPVYDDAKIHSIYNKYSVLYPEKKWYFECHHV